MSRIVAAVAAVLALAALAVGAAPASASPTSFEMPWTNAMNQASWWNAYFSTDARTATCTKFENHNGFIPAQYDAAVIKDGSDVVRVYPDLTTTGNFTAQGAINPATGKPFEPPHSWVMKCTFTWKPTTTTVPKETTTTTTTVPKETTTTTSTTTTTVPKETTTTTSTTTTTVPEETTTTTTSSTTTTTVPEETTTTTTSSTTTTTVPEETTTTSSTTTSSIPQQTTTTVVDQGGPTTTTTVVGQQPPGDTTTTVAAGTRLPDTGGSSWTMGFVGLLMLALGGGVLHLSRRPD
jgi:LPXTG-motif cell wall-anchored protein